jgi:hypothetical protein
MDENECNHCYHHTHTDSSRYPIEVRHYICCHCGKKKTKEINLYAGSKSWGYNEKKHGPYAPHITMIY